MRLKKKALVIIGLVVGAMPLLAHVGVSPRESKPGATETYTFRVPSEGGRTTTGVVLEVPDGVTIVSVADREGTTHAEKRTGDRITEVTWTLEIKPNAVAELALAARNPAQGESIVWKVHQKYADGTMSDWVGEAGSRAPAPVTKLTTAPAK